jgi:hypothetical protein
MMKEVTLISDRLNLFGYQSLGWTPPICYFRVDSVYMIWKKNSITTDFTDISNIGTYHAITWWWKKLHWFQIGWTSLDTNRWDEYHRLVTWELTHSTWYGEKNSINSDFTDISNIGTYHAITWWWNKLHWFLISWISSDTDCSEEYHQLVTLELTNCTCDGKRNSSWSNFTDI